MRRRTDNLLYQLLPREVALALRKGASAVSTCEVTETVRVKQQSHLLADV